MDQKEFRQMVDRVRLLEKAMGSTRKDVVEEEFETVIVQRRSLHIVKDMKKGDILKKEDIIELRPAVGIHPNHKKIVIGKKLNTDLDAHEALYWENFD